MRMFIVAGLIATASLASGIALAQSESTAAIAPVTGATSPGIAGVIPSPPAGKGQVVFFRKGGLVGAAISCAVHENGVKLSSLPPGRYAVVTVEPGVHSYAVQSEAKDVLRFEIEPDETYYAKCTVGAGVMAGRPNLAPVDKASFDAMSKKLKPAKKG